jgi:hypothetical protein
VHKNYGRKREGKSPHVRTRRRWEDNIKMYLGEIGWEDLYRIHLAQDRNRLRTLINVVLNLRVL